MNQAFPTARDLMSPEYLTVTPASPLIHAVARFEVHPDDTAFVVDGENRLVGLLSEKDCLHRLAAHAYDATTAETVEQVMTPDVAPLAPDADPYLIAQTFHTCACGVLPVIEDGRLVGAVSQRAVLRAFLAVLRGRAEEQSAVEQSAEDLKERPEAIERMQRVFAKLDREQLATLLHRRQ